MGSGLNDQASARGKALGLLALAGLLCALQFFANRGVLDHDWVYFDDDINVVLNPHLTGGTVDTFKWAWTDATYNRRYMPLGWLMFDGLFRAGGLNPVIYHVASWLLAAGNAVTLMLIIRRFIPRSGEGAIKTGWEDLCAALVAALFSVHPLRAETVGWASGLVYQGSMFLASLAVLAAFPVNRAAPRRGFEWLGRVLFLLSLLLYPACIGLPLLLILAAGAQTTGSWRATLLASARRHAWWLFIALVVGGINVLAAATSRTFSALDDLQHYTFGERLGRSALMLGHMLTQTVWPGSTSPYYGDLGAAPLAQKILVPLLLAIAAIVFLANTRTRQAALLFLLLLFAAVLPFIGLLDRGQTANDRYAFMLLSVVAVGFASLIVRASARSTRLAIIAGLAFATAAMLPAYRRALAVWQNTATLQARIDILMAAHPDVRLGFARPAMYAFMSADYAGSQRRLREGFARFGAHPELLATATFIEETRTSLTGSGRNPSMPPYAFMHFDLAKKHELAGHAFAARAHLEYARLLLRTGAEDRQP